MFGSFGNTEAYARAEARVDAENDAIRDHCLRFASDERSDMDIYILSWLVDDGYPGAFSSNDVLEEILKTGKCDVETPAPHGGTAIHAIAMAAKKEEALKALTLIFDYHPHLVNSRNRTTETALHLVALYGNARAARELLRRGADPTLKTYKGQDALDLVDKRFMKDGNEEELRELLRNAKADFKNKCHFPGCELSGEHRCGGCKRARYCGPEHQRQHWNEKPCGHKKLCKTYRALQSEPEVPECKHM